MNNRFRLDGYMPYIIAESEDGVCIIDQNGFYMPPEQMIQVSKGLAKFAKKYAVDIERKNTETNAEFEQMLHGYGSERIRAKRTPAKGYVYLLECGGKYKVGWSRDVARRVKELDKRPFKLNVIAKSRLTEGAFKNEQYIHERIERFKINGEWYELPEEVVNRLVKAIKSM